MIAALLHDCIYKSLRVIVLDDTFLSFESIALIRTTDCKRACEPCQAMPSSVHVQLSLSHSLLLPSPLLGHGAAAGARTTLAPVPLVRSIGPCGAAAQMPSTLSSIIFLCTTFLQMARASRTSRPTRTSLSDVKCNARFTTRSYCNTSEISAHRVSKRGKTSLSHRS